MFEKSRLLTTVLGLSLTLTACGGGDDTAAEPKTEKPAATTSAEPAPEAAATPRIAEPTVAPLEIDDSVFDLFGDADMVQAAYQEAVELATVHAVDPDYFFRDGNNSGADLADVSARLSTQQAAFLREQADLCVDPADTSNACGNVGGIVIFDMGSDAVPYTYRDDREFVTEQSVADAKAVGVIPNLGTSYLELSFDHAVRVRLMHNGTPAEWMLTRHLTYDMEPSASGSASWQISQWEFEVVTNDMHDEATGQPLDG